MLPSTRRSFLFAAASLSLRPRFCLAKSETLPIGITDWNLNLSADPAAVPLAAKLGFDAVQVSFGRGLVNGKLRVDNPEIVSRYLAESKRCNLPIDGTCVDRLHVNGLKDDPLPVKWVRDSIRLTKALNTKVLLLPFFGKRAMQARAEMDHVGDVLRDLAPEAEQPGVILGLEDTISAEDNVRIMERSRSKNVLVYYDVGNSTKNGFDVVKEIRWLGKNKICQFHLKDNPHMLGEGQIEFRPIIQAIHDIGYQGYANLETDVPKASLDADLQRNLHYIRNIISQAYA